MDLDNIPTGVSMENASYMESNDETNLISKEDSNFKTDTELDHEEEYTPQLFSNNSESDFQVENDLEEPGRDEHTEKLFDQESNEEEDFEIPAFLRKQKF